jgi:hypothetical protein
MIVISDLKHLDVATQASKIFGGQSIESVIVQSNTSGVDEKGTQTTLLTQILSQIS